MSRAEFFRQFKTALDFGSRAGKGLAGHFLKRFQELALGVKRGIADFLFGIADLPLRCFCRPVEVLAAAMFRRHKWLPPIARKPSRNAACLARTTLTQTKPSR